MSIYKTMFCCTMFTSTTSVLSQESSDSIAKMPMLSSAICVEANYGYNGYGENRARFDFPHFVANAYLNLGNGWSVETEVEYERLYDNGAWDNDFDNNFSVNKLYANKRFSDAVQLKFGILDVPVGLINSGGQILTIYDSESEAAIIPLPWHEVGVSLWGAHGKFAYSFTGTYHFSLPLRNSRQLGCAARVDYMPIEELRFGVSCYTGKSSAGMVSYSRPECLGTGSLTYWSSDFDYHADGWVVDGSFIYNAEHKCKAVGMEAGYDVMAFLPSSKRKACVIPFVRYDGFFEKNATNMTKWTFGCNVEPVANVVFKAEYGVRHGNDIGIERSLDFSLGYTFAF